MRSYILVLLLIVTLVACTAVPTTAPTSIPSPSPTTPPTQTVIPSPTSTPLPTATSTVAASTEAVNRLAVSEGFTVSVPFPLLYQVNKNIVLIGDDEKTLNISFIGDTSKGGQPLTAIIDTYLASLEKRGFQFTKGNTADVQIDGATGLTMDLTATSGNFNFEGQAVAVSPTADLTLFGLALSKTDSDKNAWKNSGKAAFDSLLNGIKFTDANAACPISTDKTYGYSQDNPVKVGGGDFEGPSRERAYLDHLKGPNNSQLTYDRQGSMDSGNTILDVFQIKGSGVSAVLYIDEYNYSELQAPVGFTCTGAFPLSTP